MDKQIPLLRRNLEERVKEVTGKYDPLIREYQQKRDTFQEYLKRDNFEKMVYERELEGGIGKFLYVFHSRGPAKFIPYSDFLRPSSSDGRVLPRELFNKVNGYFELDPETGEYSAVIQVDDNERYVRTLTDEEIDRLEGRIDRIESGAYDEARKVKEKLGIVESNIRRYGVMRAEEINPLRCKIDLLDEYVLKENENPLIARKTSPMHPEDIYSLWIGTSPVVSVEGDFLKYISTKKQDREFEMRVTPIRSMNPEAYELARTLGGINNGSFYTFDGFKLENFQEESAREIFNRVINGKRILPNLDDSRGYREIRRNGNSREQQVSFRHWGQTYLRELGPEKIIEGKLLGNGGSYRAFTFGERTAVEFDKEERATYIFDTTFFEKLRSFGRSEIIRKQPEGFRKRIIHRGKWKERVEEELTAP